MRKFIVILHQTLRSSLRNFFTALNEDVYLLGYDATLLGNWFPIFRDNILVLSSQVERSKKNAGDSWMVIKMK